jgi:hypothetical protein
MLSFAWQRRVPCAGQSQVEEERKLYSALYITNPGQLNYCAGSGLHCASREMCTRKTEPVEFVSPEPCMIVVVRHELAGGRRMNVTPKMRMRPVYEATQVSLHARMGPNRAPFLFKGLLYDP